jgi:glucosamine-6-phosphate deaminase
MKIYVVKDYRQMSLKAASIVASQVILKPNSVLGLATGSTPEGMYRELVKIHKQGTVDFREVVTFNLDEYLGLPPDHPQSYHYYMYNHLFNHINIAPENIHIPTGNEKNIEEFCRHYDRQISNAGGIDLQVLGIGVNGHIGFNEPGLYLNVQTHVVNLAEETIKANSRFFDSPGQVPRRAITMGVGSIMQSGKIILMASGKSKARAIKETVSGKVTASVPASILQLHDQVILVLDREAASLL